jgi:tripartite-type tricarboxylate transporter receptor subunit TctC
MTLRKTFLTCLSVIAFLSGASAADWPQKPVKIVVTFGAGGQSDVVARLLGQV